MAFQITGFQISAFQQSTILDGKSGVYRYMLSGNRLLGNIQNTLLLDLIFLRSRRRSSKKKKSS